MNVSSSDNLRLPVTGSEEAEADAGAGLVTGARQRGRGGPNSAASSLFGSDREGAVPSGFWDVAAGNGDFCAKFKNRGLPARAARGLAIVTCMDSRIDPLAIVGMAPGDAKILRNAGARVTDDVLRTLVLAIYLLGVNRVLVMPHSKCRMASATEDQIHALIAAEHGVDTRSMEFRTIEDQDLALARDIQRIRSNPFLPAHLDVAGALYDVDTGQLHFSA